MSGLAVIIMPVYNQIEKTLACLESMGKHTHYEDTHLFVVDNNSEPGQFETVAAYLDDGFPISWNMIGLHENRGWIGGCWEVYPIVCKSQAKWVALLNNDTVLSDSWLGRMIMQLEEHPEYGIMGCVSAGGMGWQDIGNLEQRRKVSHDVSVPQSPDDLDDTVAAIRGYHLGEVLDANMVAFFCVVLRRTMLQETGFLDRRFGLGLGDDDDLCRRARMKGWKVGVALDVPVWHWHRTTFRALAAEGIDWMDTRDTNRGLLAHKEGEMYTELTYIGKAGQYIMGVPARDLTPMDLAAVVDAGIATKSDLIRSGLYVGVEDIEIQPFCGARTVDGGVCKRAVDYWGYRCWQHNSSTAEIADIKHPMEESNND